ncbi:hypothetical protein [Streptomyces sp. NPDC049915]|uniref:hypothetical protein n=1 Tax=Streptomyces sp. NPDC049915 TaxID=3155510 RepID=UPI00341E04A0
MTRPARPAPRGTRRRPGQAARTRRPAPPAASGAAEALVAADGAFAPGRTFASDRGRTGPGTATDHPHSRPHSPCAPLPAAPGVTEDHQ